MVGLLATRCACVFELFSVAGPKAPAIRVIRDPIALPSKRVESYQRLFLHGSLQHMDLLRWRYFGQDQMVDERPIPMVRGRVSSGARSGLSALCLGHIVGHLGGRQLFCGDLSKL